MLCIGFISCSSDDYIDYITNNTNNQANTPPIINNKDTLYLAHWNIGHFSLGKYFDTSINDDNFDEKLTLYKELLDTLKIDLLGLCEYNQTFDIRGRNTYDLLLKDYPFYLIGKKHAYNCNAIFYKYTMPITICKYFDSMVQTRYYLCTSFIYKEIEVKFVESHLDWDQGEWGMICRQDQMMELAQTFKDDQYVIICADFNSSNTKEYQCFIDAGFSIAFDDQTSIGTFTTIDNIIYKGFRIVDKSIVKDYTLSDHPLYKAAFMLNTNNYNHGS